MPHTNIFYLLIYCGNLFPATGMNKTLVKLLYYISLSGLTRTARQALLPAESARAQFISLDHTTVRAVHTRKV